MFLQQQNVVAITLAESDTHVGYDRANTGVARTRNPVGEKLMDFTNDISVSNLFNRPAISGVVSVHQHIRDVGSGCDLPDAIVESSGSDVVDDGCAGRDGALGNVRLLSVDRN